MIRKDIAEGAAPTSLPQVELKNVARALVHVIVIAAILFLAAGHIDWPAAWVLTLVFIIYFAIMLVWPTLDPKIAALHEEQRKAAPGIKPWDKIILFVYPVLLLGILITAGLDAGRFHWSVMPLPIQALGTVGLVVGHGMFLWCLSANAFSSWQTFTGVETGPAIMQTGPYRYVRHPFYVATVLVAIGGALTLGSGWALVPAGAIAPLFIVRTALEDRALHDELPGYRNYTSRVKYRMFPGIW